MYSPYLQDYLNQVSSYAQVNPNSVRLLNDTLACFIGTLGKSIGARTEPPGDLLKVSVQLLMLDDGLGKLAETTGLESAHYLVGLGFEQTGELLGRIEGFGKSQRPLDNDYWYRMTLAFLHYLAGGHRVQARSALRHLENITKQYRNVRDRDEYQDAFDALRQLYSTSDQAVRKQQRTIEGINWNRLILEDGESTNSQQLRISRLANQIRRRHDIVLKDLGQENEASWLSQRGIDDPTATDFWTKYLKGLDQRGIHILHKRTKRS